MFLLKQNPLILRGRVLTPLVMALIAASGPARAQLGHQSQARVHYERALTIREDVLASGHPDLARSLDGLAAVMIQQAEYAEAESVARRAIAIHERGATEPVELGRSLGQLGQAQAGQNKLAEAESSLRRSLEIMERELDASHPVLASTRESYDRVRSAAAMQAPHP